MVREIRYTLPYRKGMRTRQVTLATTLLDPVLYPRMTRPRAFLKQHPGYYGK